MFAKPSMFNLNIGAILTTLLVVAATQSLCQEHERPASDYLIPFYREKGVNPEEINRDAQWLEEIIETFTVGRKLHELRDFLSILRKRIVSGLSPSSEFLELEFSGLKNDDFSRITGNLIESGGRTRVVVKMVDALILIAKPEFRCRFDFWTIISQFFYSLYGIPEKDGVTIHEGGMRFGSRDAKQPQTKLYKYIKYYTSNYLARCLTDLEVPIGFNENVQEAKIDSIFADTESKVSLTDEELWRAAFKGDMKEEENSDLLSDEVISDKLIAWFATIKADLEVRVSMEKSAGMITLAMALAPEELRKFKSMSFTLSKQVEYLRLFNQYSYCITNCTFVSRDKQARHED